MDDDCVKEVGRSFDGVGLSDAGFKSVELVGDWLGGVELEDTGVHFDEMVGDCSDGIALGDNSSVSDNVVIFVCIKVVGNMGLVDVNCLDVVTVLLDPVEPNSVPLDGTELNKRSLDGGVLLNEIWLGGTT